jgi:hypothetical protein
MSKHNPSPSHVGDAVAYTPNTSLSTFATGLAAWLGGVAFCVGVGVSAPVWVAGVLTMLSMAIVAAGAVRARREL